METPMVKLGEYNTLTVVKIVPFGIYLDGGELGEVLMPSRYVPRNCAVGDRLEVFLYLDSEDLPIATTQRPLAQVGQCACLKVVAVSRVGAFLDWGLEKDLLLPFSEQKKPAQEGESVIVCLYLDRETHRIVASAKLDKFLDKYEVDLQRGDKVKLLIAGQTDLGYKAVVNDLYWGVLYRDEVFRPLNYGELTEGYVKKVRPDEKIDLFLQRPGYAKDDALSALIMQTLQKAGGFLPVTDKSPPEEIARLFGVSKKKYKMAVGALFKQRRLSIDKDGLRLVKG